MRKYREQDKNQILEVYCNCCGRKLRTDKNIILEGVFQGRVPWGYFSEKDEEVHSFDICEACYDKWIASFEIPVENNSQNELL